MGLVHIYCGDGKGKTSAAIGLAVRAAGRGKQVVFARFLKTEDSGEVPGLGTLPGITVLPCEKSFGFVSAMDEQTRREAAVYNRSLLERAVTEVRGKDVLVLDELLAAVSYGFIPEERVLVLLSENRERLEIVMTGRRAPEALLSEADYVSEIVKRAHPYDRGILARMGIEY